MLACDLLSSTAIYDNLSSRLPGGTPPTTGQRFSNGADEPPAGSPTAVPWIGEQTLVSLAVPAGKPTRSLEVPGSGDAVHHREELAIFNFRWCFKPLCANARAFHVDDVCTAPVDKMKRRHPTSMAMLWSKTLAKCSPTGARSRRPKKAAAQDRTAWDA